jgi:RNA polymerase sigma-70 factor (ECF subfamily)
MATGEITLGAAEGLIQAQAQETHLVDRCRQGDPEAFARLVALHESMVFNLAYRMTGDPEEARDVSQDVFLQVYRKLGRFEGRSSLRTWIYRIVINQCHNRQRWWRRRRQDRVRALDELSASDEARLTESRPQADAPFEAVERREAARRVQAALLGLKFDQRAILLLREVEGLSCEEIAQSLGVPEGTVKSRLSRAREALRARLVETSGPGGAP